MSVIAVVLAGGRGTRSADPGLAKLAQEIEGASLMEWHLRLLHHSGIDHVVVVAGHLGDQVRTLCESFAHPWIRVEVVQEDEQRGTVAALLLAAQQHPADRFLVILGDILMSFPVDDFIAKWQASGRGVAVAVHPSTHPEDSDTVFENFDGSVSVVAKSAPRDRLPNSSSTGLFAISRVALERYSDQRDFGSDVLPAAAAASDLFVYVSSHYFKDTGTPNRLDAAARDVEAGAFRRRGELGPRAAVFLDRDGVINPDRPEISNADAYTLLPGVAAAIRTANSAGIPVLIVTNQSRIAKGFITFAEHQAIRARMDALLGAEGAFVDDYAFCPHHPDTGFDGEVAELKGPCDCRKPGTGMATRLAAHHHLDLHRSVMVGDTDRDQGLALAAGMGFVHVSPDCDLTPDHPCRVEASEAILRAIEMVEC